MKPAATVIGAGGLLGSAAARTTQGAFDPVRLIGGLEWTDPVAAAAAISAVHGELLRADRARPLVVMWCAGSGRVGTPAEQLAGETALLRRVLADLAQLVDRPQRVAFCLASSAGGVWSGSPESFLDEGVPPCPWHDYGRVKLTQEAIVSEQVAGSQLVALVARISNLYGPPPRSHPLTGLVNNMAFNAIRRQPTALYVPIDTQRDYISSDAAAALMQERTTALLDDAPAGTVRTQVVASGRSHTIGCVADVLGRVLGRHVPISVGYSQTASEQPRTLVLRSVHVDLESRGPHLAHEVHTLVRALMTWRG